MVECMDKSSPSWAAHCDLMACRLVALDKRPGVCPVGIRETLCRVIDTLVMSAAGDQDNTACGSLQLCVGIEASIYGATHTLVQRRLERTTPVSEGRAEEKSEDGIEATADNVYSDGDEAAVVGVGEVLVPPGRRQVT